MLAVLFVPPVVAIVTLNQRTRPPRSRRPKPVVALPNKEGSFKFAVLGDFGTGTRSQYQLAEQMAKLHGRFKYHIVVLVGDNLYGSERPQDFQKKFEIPYKPLLDAGVKFYGALGNHDAREQRYLQAVQHGRKAVLHHSTRNLTCDSFSWRARIRCLSRSSGWSKS